MKKQFVADLGILVKICTDNGNWIKSTVKQFNQQVVIRNLKIMFILTFLRVLAKAKTQEERLIYFK